MAWLVRSVAFFAGGVPPYGDAKEGVLLNAISRGVSSLSLLPCTCATCLPMAAVNTSGARSRFPWQVPSRLLLLFPRAAACRRSLRAPIMSVSGQVSSTARFLSYHVLNSWLKRGVTWCVLFGLERPPVSRAELYRRQLTRPAYLSPFGSSHVRPFSLPQLPPLALKR